MSQILHTHLRLLLDTLLRRDHHYAHGMDAFAKDISNQETELEKHPLLDQVLNPKLLVLLTCWF